ncbi:MAG: hypothetical protein GX986_06525 [Firmicutes bacterium]|nr:hypothetical protein [Bacillota bacterium]
MTVAVPKEAIDASYHGSLILAALNLESGELVSQRTVPLSVLVGIDHTPQAELRSLQAEKSEEGHLLSLDMTNIGNVDLTPIADIVISTESGDFVERAALTMPEDVERVIPLQKLQLTGTATGLDQGTYHVKVSLSSGSSEILFEEMTVDIE